MRRLWAVLLASSLAAACSDETDPLARGDAGPTTPHDDAAPVVNDDATTPAPDATPADPDAGGPPDSGVVTMGDPSVQVLDVGTVHLDNGVSQTVTTTLPPDVVSFMIVIDGPDEAQFITYKLDGPMGVLVSDDASTVSQLESFLLGPYAAQFKSPNRVTQDFGLSAAQFPGNPGVTITGGEYRLVVGGLRIQGQNGVPFTGDVTVKYYYRRAVPAAGRLDLHLYFTGASGITADTAPTDQRIIDTIARFRTIYQQANVEIGAVSYHSADMSFQTITNIEGNGGDLEQLFQQSAGNGRGLHFFFIDRFMGGFPGAMVAGIAGGLPGAPDNVGSVGAGVAVALSTVQNDPAIIAHVMAHEAGHWLGLFHTSEFTGTTDQHPETPPGMMGNTYLMYPAVGGGTTISPSQGTVMRLHAETVGQ